MHAAWVTGFPIIFEVVGIAGHRNPDPVVCQELVERCKFFVSFCGITAARKAWMTDDRHDELAPTTFERALDPRALSVIHPAQDSGIYCNQCKVVGLQFKERRSLASGLDAVQTPHALGVFCKPVVAARI